MGGDRYTILFEVFKELFQTGEISVFELRERLRRKGILPDEGSVRRFYYYLQKLEDEGFVISEKRGKKKYIKPLLGNNNLSLGDRWSGLVTFLLLTLPQTYRNLLGRELQNFSKQFLGFDISGRISGDFYFREMVFLPDGDYFEYLGLLVKAIRFNWLLSVYTLKGESIKFVPKHLHFRDGKVFAIGFTPGGGDVKLRVDYIKALSPLGEFGEDTHWRLNPEMLYEPNEKPFVFGIAFHEVYMHAGENDPEIIFPTQYYAARRGEYYVYYLLGFTGDRFAQKFLTILYDDILEPAEDMLKRLELLKGFYPLPPDNLEENVKRFLLFLETVEKHLDLRNGIVKRLKMKHLL